MDYHKSLTIKLDERLYKALKITGAVTGNSSQAMMTKALCVFLDSFSPAFNRPIKFSEQYKSLTLKVNKDLYVRLKTFCVSHDVSAQSLLVTAIDAYLFNCQSIPACFWERSSYIYLARPENGVAVKVGKTVLLKERLSLYRQKSSDIGYYAVWKLTPEFQVHLDSIESEILDKYRVGAFGVSGGIRQAADSFDLPCGSKIEFPFKTSELLSFSCYDAVSLVGGVLKGRAYRVL